jgi:hypothetical protein
MTLLLRENYLFWWGLEPPIGCTCICACNYIDKKNTQDVEKKDG